MVQGVRVEQEEILFSLAIFLPLLNKPTLAQDGLVYSLYRTLVACGN